MGMSLSLQIWEGETQLVGNHNFSSYVVARKVDRIWDITPTANLSFKFDEKDENRFCELWEWAANRILQHPTINLEHWVKISELYELGSSETFLDKDLTVMVVAKSTFPVS